MGTHKSMGFQPISYDTQTMASVHGGPQARGWRYPPSPQTWDSAQPTARGLWISAFETFQKGGQATAAPVLIGPSLVYLVFLIPQGAHSPGNWVGRERLSSETQQRPQDLPTRDFNPSTSPII